MEWDYLIGLSMDQDYLLGLCTINTTSTIWSNLVMSDLDQLDNSKSKLGPFIAVNKFFVVDQNYILFNNSWLVQ